MDKTVGIPRSLFYYEYGSLWEKFFEELKIPYLISPKTNAEIIKLGRDSSVDEMCLSLKNYLGHVKYLEDKVDYILVPRIDNYGTLNQTCTNYLAAYDISTNVTNTKILNYNIDVNHHETEEKAFMNLGRKLNKKKKEIRKAYHNAKVYQNELLDAKIQRNYNLLNSTKKKILLVSHDYVLEDETMGAPVVELLKKQNIAIIDANLFDRKVAMKFSKKLSKSLYWDISRKLVGAIPIVEHDIDGIIFLSNFPCGLDSLVNELMIRKIKKPYLNLIMDEVSTLTGIETRIESFLDILNEKSY